MVAVRTPSLSFLAAGALAAVSARGAVVTSTPFINISSNSPPASTNAAVPFDVNGDGVNDFSFGYTNAPVAQPIAGPGGNTKYDYNGKLTLDAATAGQFLAVVKDADGAQTTDFNAPAYLGNYAETLAVGTTVGPNSTFVDLSSPSYDDRLLDSMGSGDGGAFSVATGELPTSTSIFGTNVAYVGFKLGSNFGYLEFTGIDDDTAAFFGDEDYNGDARISGIAFETTPNKSIVVRGITVAETPEPATLAATAGVAMVTIARRRRRA